MKRGIAICGSVSWRKRRSSRSVYARTLAHCWSRRLAETGIAVPSRWANSDTRYSSIIQRNNANSGSSIPC